MDPRPLGGEHPEDLLGRLLRQAREPFASTLEEAGFSVAVLATVRAARRMIEASPEVLGELGARGVRDEGGLWFVGEVVESARAAIGHSHLEPASDRAALIPVRVFTMIAYRHPYFDGNKRTAFLAALLWGYFLGFNLKVVSYREIEEQVREPTAREAPDTEEAAWFLGRVFISPGTKEARS